MMECKNALQASGNDVSKAVDWLRKKGKAAASKSAGRVASQGLVAYSIGENGDVGSLIEVRPLKFFSVLPSKFSLSSSPPDPQPPCSCANTHCDPPFPSPLVEQ